MRSIAVAFVLLGSLTSALGAQEPLSFPLVAMEKLSFLVGEWEGEGWIQYEGSERIPFKATERVESRLGGLVLLLEGTRTGHVPGREGEVTLLHAFGVLSFDGPGNRYLMRAIRQDGSHVDGFFEFDGDFVQWGYDDPQLGALRSTVRLNESGQWYGVGDISRDETNWHRLYEVTLNKLTSSE